ncbi:hypothetical protein ACFLQU_04995 [Verrucomicrobiota bacterium]
MGVILHVLPMAKSAGLPWATLHAAFTANLITAILGALSVVGGIALTIPKSWARWVLLPPVAIRLAMQIWLGATAWPYFLQRREFFVRHGILMWPDGLEAVAACLLVAFLFVKPVSTAITSAQHNWTAEMRRRIAELYPQRRGPIWLIVGLLVWSIGLLWICCCYVPWVADFADNIVGGKRLFASTLALINYSRRWWLVVLATFALLTLVSTVRHTGAFLRIVVTTSVSVVAILCAFMTYLVVEGTRGMLQKVLEREAPTQPTMVDTRLYRRLVADGRGCVAVSGLLAHSSRYQAARYNRIPQRHA